MNDKQKKPEINKALVNRVKRILLETGAPMIPMSLLFEQLGYTGLQGIYWGILSGVVSALAVELGFEVSKFGSQIVLKKPDTNSLEKESSDKKEEGEVK
jgi:hypothetical protein